jgi:RNA polymerase sigma-70 factor (sigma-E family)
MMADRAQFDEFVVARSQRLLGTAYLLTRDWASAEDLLQDAMTKAWFAWPRLSENPEAYVKKIIVTTYVSQQRRRWRRERPLADLPEHPEPHDVMGGADDRDTVWRAIGRLPARQRAVIVLRFYEDLSEADTAMTLGCSIGTVKSQSARALDKLRVDDSLAPTRSRGEL